MANASFNHTGYVQYGCGLCVPPAWTNFDASPTLRIQRIPLLGPLLTRKGFRFPDNALYVDIVNGLPVAPESCHAVYCSHVLEHQSLEDCRSAVHNTFSYISHELEEAGFAAIRRATFGDSSEPRFADVEDKHRWDVCLRRRLQRRGLGGAVGDPHSERRPLTALLLIRKMSAPVRTRNCRAPVGCDRQASPRETNQRIAS